MYICVIGIGLEFIGDSNSELTYTLQGSESKYGLTGKIQCVCGEHLVHSYLYSREPKTSYSAIYDDFSHEMDLSKVLIESYQKISF